ncbi:ABC transporter permease [Dictyobacter formicarum]|uniref:Glutathione ABC transporter permease n=1 Tax=Dictyobacter formicarum TaxID=2778368 RepID=A0ABQ3V8Q6_9CHLR|nr:ABC transporter permease [Dictyobacter formicarum]GHO82043.1 glutathione ABC transporter permease [Dictyobacter formicarum]
MLQFLLKRLLGLLFVLFGVSFITFIIGYFSPIDPVLQLLGQHYTPESYARLRHAYGLDLPWYLQYFHYIVNLLHFDLGRSIHNQSRRVIDLLKDGIPISAEIATWGLLITLLLGIPAGILSAIKANTWIDTTNMVLALTLYALPVFIIAIFAQLLVVWLNVNWDLEWPVTSWGTPWQYSWSDIQFKLVPILVYGLAGYAYYARLARTSMLEVLRQDYVRTARAKGLRERTVVYRHALRNALLPVITVLGLSIGLLITGAFFIERIFNIQGIGLTTINAVSQGDFPVIQATALLAALGVVAGNMISDILYTIVDPRIKLS